MKKQTFDRIKKTLAVLLVVLLIATLTATSVSANTEKVKLKNSAYDKEVNNISIPVLNAKAWARTIYGDELPPWVDVRYGCDGNGCWYEYCFWHCDDDGDCFNSCDVPRIVT